ncbi:MAG: serine/threonine-protein kinase [Dokdonella sp.]
MTTEPTPSHPDSVVLAQMDALFDLLAEHDDSQQLDRLELLSDRFSAEAVAAVRKLLQGIGRHAGFFDQPAVRRVSLDRRYTTGESLGRWRVDGELGRGGQAIALAVSRLEGGFEQQAVLKMPLSTPPSPDAVRRMLRERQLLASLAHPGLPSMIDGGVLDDGAPYLVIERIVGQPIDAYADTKQLSLRDRVALLRKVANIVSYAHAQLVLHRDIKPANILIDGDGRVVLLDFGVAQSLQADASATSVGYTLAFAAPEQVRGDRSSAATDVYGLAALACRLLAGEVPFPGMQASAQVRAVLEDTPKLPAGLDRDLAAILQRAMRKEPQSRYASVAEFDAELQRWQLHLPVLAHAGGHRYRLRKWLRRRGVLVAVATVLIAATGAALWQANRANEFARKTEQERDLATRDLRRQELLQEHYASLFNRLLASDKLIAPDALIAEIADTRQTVVAQNPDAQDSLQLAVADLQLVRNDFAAAIDALEALAPRRARLSPWEQVSYAETLAVSYLRVGRVDEVDAVLLQGEVAASAVPDSRISIARASLAIVRAQLLRSKGDLAGSLELARRAVELSDSDTFISPMRLGQLRTNAGLSAMYAGDIVLARQWARRGLDDWQRAGLQSNVSYLTASANLANLEQLSGHPAKALELYDEIESQSTASDNAPGHWAGQLSMARALALMGKDQPAMTKAEDASTRFCAVVGPDTLDCQRVRLSTADIANWLGNRTVAARKIESISFTDAPAIAENLQLARALLQINVEPTPENVVTANTALIAVTAQGGLGIRGAIRQRLGAAERLLAAGHASLANQLIAPLLLDPPGDDLVDGIDRIWLRLWQARAAGALAAQNALTDALAKELGGQHPSVLRWNTWLAGSATSQ